MRNAITGLLIGSVGLAAIFVLMGARSSNLSLNVGIGNAAALQAFGMSLESVNKFGDDGDIDQVEESIWDADDLPTAGAGPGRCFVNSGATADTVFLSSSSDSDVGLVVTVEALDANHEPVNVDVTLGSDAGTGTTAVQIGVVDLLRINRMFSPTSNLTGDIYASLDSDVGTDGVPDTPATDIIAAITAGENQTLQACFTVKAGFTATLRNFCTSNISNAGNNAVVFRIRRNGVGFASRTQEKNEIANGVYTCTPHDPPIAFEEKTDIEMTALSAGNNAAVTATFDLLMFPNAAF